MAKLKLVRNAFDLTDIESFDLKERVSVRDFIDRQRITARSFSNTYEVYDPDTDETIYCLADDDTDETLNVNVMVNGIQRDLDYTIELADYVVLTILPAGKAGAAKGLSVGGSLIALAGSIILMAASAGASSILGIAMSQTAMYGIGTAALLTGAVCSLIAGNLLSEDGKVNELDADNPPRIAGSMNQPLTGNSFPLVIGDIECSPFLVGSPYNEFIVSDTFDKSWLGYKQLQNVLMAIGYAPLYVDDIKLDGLSLTHNPNHILDGKLSHSLNATFNGSKEQSEFGSTWNNNKFEVEIKQFGNKHTIFDKTVKQENRAIPLLYCYDKSYNAVAREENISYQGSAYPAGYRTNSIYFTQSVPWKIAVGIEFPGGLYATWTENDGDNVYMKLPMNLVIQWRPVYKYIEDNSLEGEGDGDDVYDNKAESPVYDTKRYGGWRNFDDGKIVKKIKYNNTKAVYYTYRVNGNLLKDSHFYYLKGDRFWDGSYETLGDFKRVNYAKYETDFVAFYNKMVTQYLSDNFEIGFSYSKWASAKDSYVHYGTYYQMKGTKQKYTEKQARRLGEKFANKYAYNYFIRQDLMYIDKNNYYEEDKSIPSVSRNEVMSNVGLSMGTSSNSNPYWNGIEAFSFGKYSCGLEGGKNGIDPSIIPGVQLFNIQGAKDSMSFEITATLTQEDILDLINRNPMSKRICVNKDSGALYGSTDVVIDSVQVRVIRLTPCYLDGQINKGKENQHDVTYSDIVKWTYIKTYCIDKQKLLNDIDYKQFDENGNEMKYAKINCAFDDESLGKSNVGGFTYKNWNISDYYSSPLNEEDSRKLVTMAIKCEPDKLGYVTNSLKRISVSAHAITPALKNGFLRYWHTEGNRHYYLDYYDSETTVTSGIYPVFDPSEWTYDEEGLYDPSGKVSVAAGYEYEVLNREWNKRFFPQKIEKKEISVVATDPNGNIIYNEDGSERLDVTRNGNDWIPYIKHEMSRYKDSLGRWVATNSFLNTFTGQNAIGQALNVLTGNHLGLDAKGYNVRTSEHYVTLWHRQELAGNVNYYRYDTDCTKFTENTYVPPLPVNLFNMGAWTRASDTEYNQQEKIDVPEKSISYGFRKVKSDVNMLALKEAWNYTDSMNLGCGAIKWKCNMYVYRQQKLQDLFASVLSAGLAYWFYDEAGQYEIHNDKPKKNPVLLITDEDCISSSNTREFRRGIGGYHITYPDEDNGFQNSELFVMINGQTKENHTRDIIEASLSGITNGIQAKSYGNYLLRQSQIQREAWVRKLNHIGSALTYGSLVEVQGTSLMIGTDHSGRIARLLEDSEYIYGFISDGTYEYRAEYNPDGSNVQGCTIMQSKGNVSSRVVTLRFANKTQQDEGIRVMSEGNTVVYKNLKGETNLVLFEKKIIKDKNRLEDQKALARDVDLKLTSVTSMTPSMGDVIAFGNVGSITSPAVVFDITYDDNGKMSVSLYPYNEGLYSAEPEFPVVYPNVTRKPIVSEIPLNETVNYTQLTEKLNETVGKVMDHIPEQGTPDSPILSAVARKDYIELSFNYPESQKAEQKNAITMVVWEIEKDESDIITFETAGNTTYMFDRLTDGYPESEDLSKWKVRATVYNTWQNKATTSEYAIDTRYYGTWIPAPVNVETRVSDRTITLVMNNYDSTGSSIERYGNLRYKIQVRRHDDEVWYAPDMNSNPYPEYNPDGSLVSSNEFAYRGEEDSFYESNSVFVMCMPLQGQGIDRSDQRMLDDTSEIGLSDTMYWFNIKACNESGNEVSRDPFNVIALCTSLRDIVNAKMTAKESYIESLSAISANLGSITSGSMTNNGNNYWALSDGNGFKEGAFRVGGENEYLVVMPPYSPGNDTDSFKIEFKVGDFTVSTTATEINGDITLIEDENTSLDRALLGPNKIALQHRNSIGSAWIDKTYMDTSGIMGMSYRSNKHILIGNFSQVQQRVLGHDIGRPYLSDEAKVWHFDDDVLCNDGTEGGLVIAGDYSLVGKNQSVKTMDYTPAVLDTAPYCINAKSITGNIRLEKTVEDAVELCVDFWLQFSFAEAQTLFSISNVNDGIKLQLNPDEPVAVVSGACSWKERTGDIVWTKNRNPIVGDDVYSGNPDNGTLAPVGVISSLNKSDSYLVLSIVLSGSSAIYQFESGDADSNWEIFAPKTEWYPSYALANAAIPGTKEIVHTGYMTSEPVDLSEFGKDFKEGAWAHIAVIFSPDDIQVMFQPVDDKIPGMVSFDRYSSARDDFNIILNNDMDTILIDELYIDNVSESEEDFARQTRERFPWGALDNNDTDGWFIFDARNPNKVKSNILDTFKANLLNSTEFSEAVKKILQS